MDTLKDVIDDMIFRTTGAMSKAKQRLDKHKGVKPVTVAQYLSSIVKLLVFLSQEVVNFRTKSQQHLDKLLADVDRVLIECCQKKISDNAIECKQKIEQDEETLKNLKKDLKRTLETVLTEKMQAFKAIKDNQSQAAKTVEQSFQQHIDKLSSYNKDQLAMYKQAIQDEVKSFSTQLLIARTELKKELLKPLKDAEDSVEQLKSLLVLFEKTLQSLQKIVPAAKSISDSADSIDKSVLSIKTTASALGNTSTNINNASKGIVESTNKLDGSASLLNTSADKINTSIDQINTTLTGVQTSAESLNTQVGMFNTSADEVNTKLAGLKTSTDSLNTQVGKLNDSASQVNTTLIGVKTSAGSLNTQVGKLNTSAGEVNTTLASVKASADSLNTQVDKLNTSARQVNTTLAGVNTSADSLNTQVDKLNTSASQVNTTLTGVKTSADTLNTQVGKLNTSVNQINTNAEGIKTKADLINTQANNITTVLSQVNTTASNINDTANFINTSAEKMGTSATKIDTSTNLLQTQIQNLTDQNLTLGQRTGLVQTVERKLSDILDSINAQSKVSFDTINQVQTQFVEDSQGLLQKTEDVAKLLVAEQKKVDNLQKSIQKQQEENKQGIQSISKVVTDSKTNSEHLLKELNKSAEKQSALVEVIQQAQKDTSDNLLSAAEQKKTVKQLTDLVTQLNTGVTTQLSKLMGTNSNTDLTQIVRKIDLLQEKINNLDLQMANNLSSVDQTMTDHTKLNQFATDVYKALAEELENKMQTHFQKYQNEVQNIHNVQSQTWLAEVSALKQLTEERVKALAEVEQNLLDQQSNYQNTFNQIAQQKVQLDQLNKQYAQQYSAWENAINQTNELQSQQQLLQESVTRAINDKVTLQRQYEELQDKIETARKDWSKQTQEHTQATVEKLKQIDELTKQVNKYMEEEQELKLKNKEQLAELTKLTDKVQLYQQTYNKSQKELDKLDGKRNTLQKQLLRLQSEKESQEQQIEEAKSQFYKNIVQLEAVKGQLQDSVIAKRTKLDIDETPNNRQLKQFEKQLSMHKKRPNPMLNNYVSTQSQSQPSLTQIQNAQSIPRPIQQSSLEQKQQRINDVSERLNLIDSGRDEQIPLLPKQKKTQSFQQAISNSKGQTQSNQQQQYKEKEFYPDEMVEDWYDNEETRFSGMGSQSVKIASNMPKIIRAKGSRIKKAHGSNDNKYASLNDDSLYDVSQNGEIKEVQTSTISLAENQSERVLSSDSRFAYDVNTIVDEAITEKQSDLGWLFLGVGGISAVIVGGYVYKKHRDQQRARYYQHHYQYD